MPGRWPGFRAGLERLSHASFYYHFVASRLRLQLRTNDFSHWFEQSLGLPQLAARADRIDIYINTLDTARKELIELVDREIVCNDCHPAMLFPFRWINMCRSWAPPK